MVFEAHGMSFPCTELLLLNYAKVNTVFPFYGTFKTQLNKSCSILPFIAPLINTVVFDFE